MIAAAYLPPDVLSQSQKLALMKIADSADDETRLARPGLTRLAAWVGVTDKRAITIVTELIAKGLVERVEIGKAGRSAVYRVFPLGVPPTPTTPDLKAAAEARRAAPKNPRKARSGVARSAPAKPAMTYQDVEAREAERQQRAQKPQVEAGFHAGNPGSETGFHGGNPEAEEGRVPPVEPDEFHGGNPLGSSDGTPSFLGPSSVLPFPPTPTADAVGEPAPAPTDTPKPDREEEPNKGCVRHQGRPAASCRACGTNPRAGRQKEREEAKVAEHQAHGRFWDDWHEDAASRRQQVEERPESVESARRAVREALLESKSRRQQKT
ncbi:helix-turn-helix domain-containing protein [Streptomyces sp. H39-C1]|uniref:helix-turn-helix domain-containing protein n=1 Tax=Streptomyces sp. H39-C1 TaxID=3004355 RepID=UPI0022AFCA3C|nr:helix-turn-helix domain-containing protein [Streptomyces sp. H39-C1]MCZ4099808.1 helix-turn-helix domain-containing protein [Streptomyces sp. H39-C1]